MSKQPHKLITRQLKKAGLLNECDTDPRLARLVELVSAAYVDFENGSLLLEHAIDLSSREMSEANQQLRKLAAEAQQAAQLKGNFLANMSHEIRTPINGILGLSSMLTEHVSTAEGHNILEMLTRSSHGLLTVINDVLDLSKIEAGKLAITPRAVTVRNVVTELGALFMAAVRERRLELVTAIDDSVPELITIDDGRLRQILTNLIGNAVKFTPEGGGILVYVRSVDSESSSPKLSFVVADSGIGIPKDYLSQIFEAFSQANSSVSRKYGGTGLGLTITRRLAHIMEGDLSVRSKEGIGTLVEVTLPLVLAKPLPSFSQNNEEGVTSDLPLGPPLKILLAEDNVVNQKVALHTLQKLGVVVAVASTGRQAVELFKDTEFDLILMDCQMPEMSGFEATSRIRETSTGARVPIIALTALAMEGDREKCLAVGMDDYISKPFNKEELKRVIRMWCGKERI